MKFNYKKIASVLAATAMLGSTLVSAAAFSGSANDYTVVYGASTDLAAATDLAGSLSVGATATAVEGGELLEVAGDVLGYGDEVLDMIPAGMGPDELPNVLADGTFKESKGDTDNDVTYTQTIDLGAGGTELVFDMNDNADDEAAGSYLQIVSGTNLYTYTLEFDDTVEYDDGDEVDDLEGATIEIQGSTYTITDVTDNGAGMVDLELMGGTTETTQGEYETKSYTVNGKAYSVEVIIIADNTDPVTVKFKVNGETTDAMEEGDTYELEDGTVIGVREIMPNEGSEATGADQVTFYLGANKVTLTDGGEVELNGESIDDYTTDVTFTTAKGELDAIEIELESDEDIFIAPGEAWTDPVFGSWSLSFGALDKATEMMTVDTTGGGEGSFTFTNNDGDEIEIPLIAIDDAGQDATAFGNEDDFIDNNAVADANGEGIHAVGIGTAMAFADGDQCVSTGDANACNGFLFLVTSATNEARLYSVEDIDTGDNKLDIVDEQTGTKIKDDVDDGAIAISGMGTVTIDVNANDVTFTTIALAGTVDTDLGAELTLDDPADTTATVLIASPNGDDLLTVTGDADGDMTADIQSAGFMDIEEDSDKEVALDTDSWGTIYTNEDTTEDTKLTVEYPEEIEDDSGVSALVYAAEGAGTASSTGAAPVMVSALTEAQKAKHLLVVGGSCINTLAAKLLTGAETPVCAADFTALTTVGAGEYLIQSFTNPYASGKKAVLVAGYEAADTVNAVNALQTDGIPAAKVVGPTLS